MTQEPNFRAEANRIITDLFKLPEDMRRNDLMATLVAMYCRGHDNGVEEGIKEAAIGTHHLPSGRKIKFKEVNQ